MNPLFRFILSAIVAIECLIALRMGYGMLLTFQSKNIHTDIVVPVDKSNLIFSQGTNLQYFYEPAPDTKLSDHPDWLSFSAIYSINSDSLNDRYNYTIDKPANTYRIVTLGDSMTFGLYNDTKDSWPEQLEDMLRTGPCESGKQFQVINLGVHGYDVQYIAQRYAVRGSKYNPDLVIWFESGSGFSRTIELWQPFIDKYNQTLTDQDREAYRAKGLYYPSWSLARQEVRTIYGDAYIAELVRSWWNDFFWKRGNTPVLITTFENLSSKEKAALRSWINGKPRVFAFTGISSLYNRDGLLPDNHPNARGHHIIALDTYKYLRQSGLLWCR